MLNKIIQFVLVLVVGIAVYFASIFPAIKFLQAVE